MLMIGFWDMGTKKPPNPPPVRPGDATGWRGIWRLFVIPHRSFRVSTGPCGVVNLPYHCGLLSVDSRHRAGRGVSFRAVLDGCQNVSSYLLGTHLPVKLLELRSVAASPVITHRIAVPHVGDGDSVAPIRACVGAGRWIFHGRG